MHAGRRPAPAARPAWVGDWSGAAPGRSAGVRRWRKKSCSRPGWRAPPAGGGQRPGVAVIHQPAAVLPGGGVMAGCPRGWCPGWLRDAGLLPCRVDHATRRRAWSCRAGPGRRGLKESHGEEAVPAVVRRGRSPDRQPRRLVVLCWGPGVPSTRLADIRPGRFAGLAAPAEDMGAGPAVGRHGRGGELHQAGVRHQRAEGRCDRALRRRRGCYTE